MYRNILMVLIVSCVSVLAPAAWAQPADPSQKTVVNPEIAAIMASFPSGGAGLRSAIAGAIENDSALIGDVVVAANSANSYQWQAIRLALEDAANFFAAIGSNVARDADRQIQTALGPLNAGVGTAVGTVLQPEVMQGVPGFSNASGAISECISPSRPGC